MKPWQKGVCRSKAEAKRQFRDHLNYLREEREDFDEDDFKNSECIECPNCGLLFWFDDSVGEHKCCSVECLEDYEESLCETSGF